MPQTRPLMSDIPSYRPATTKIPGHVDSLKNLTLGSRRQASIIHRKIAHSQDFR